MLISEVEVVILLMIPMLCFKYSKNVNVKVFNLISWANETKHLVSYESCECKCGLNESVCNSKKTWNHDECWS